jgi:hypothetical protein
MPCLFLNSLIMHITLQILLSILGQNKLKKKKLSVERTWRMHRKLLKTSWGG